MKTTTLFAALAGLALSALFTLPANAQATRTFVSGVGDDANPCSRTAPCKTFAGAIPKTAAGGEIDTLDPGGFGAVTITKAMTIAGEGTGVAGVLTTASSGIVVNCVSDPTCVVQLRGLVIDGGPNGTSSSGVRFVGGKALQIQNSVIRNYKDGGTGYGVFFQPTGASQLDISDTVITSNGAQGAGASVGAGIGIIPQSGGSAKVTITNVKLANNSNGIRIDNTAAAAPTQVLIRDTVISASATHGLAAVNPTSGTPQAASVSFTNSAISGSAGYGVVVNGVNTTVALDNAVVQANARGYQIANGGVIKTFQNNKFFDNATASVGTLTTVPSN